MTALMASLAATPHVMERIWRGLLVVAAAALMAVGVVAFVLPDLASANFPWTVGPFLATTIGGWSLGTAVIAWRAAGSARIDLTYPLLAYLWVFGVGQLAVVALFFDRLQAGHLLTLPYLVGIGSLAVSGVAGVADWMTRRPDLRGSAGTVPRWAKPAGVAFVGAVLLLALANVVAGPDGTVAQGRFFPELMSLFSIRAFAAFFLALATSVAVVLVARDFAPYLELARAGLYLIVPITAAALFYLHLFDFTGRPGGMLYLGAYVLVGFLATVALVTHARREPLQVSE
jgi:hypothetical protein